MHCDQGLIVVIVYYFQIWNKKKQNKQTQKQTKKTKQNIIISRVINSHIVVFWPSTWPKMPFRGDAPEGGDTF